MKHFNPPLVNGLHFQVNDEFQQERLDAFLKSLHAKTPVVFIGNLHATPSIEYGFIFNETETLFRIAFMHNILYFCGDFEGPVEECVTAKACDKKQCFLVSDWANFEQEIKKPYLVDRKPVDSNELIQMAKDEGYNGNLLFTRKAAAILRNNNHIVENNNYPL